MDVVRHSLFALGAVTVLVGSLVFLYPGSSVSATQVTLPASGVTSLDKGTDDDGATQADNHFDLTVSIALAAGEHIPLNYAQVRVAAAGAPLDADGRILAATVCTATTGGSPRVDILAVSGATRVAGGFVGTGYDVVDTGYGFAFDNPSPVDFSGYNGGYGYGYGGATPGADLLQVTLRVTGCTFAFDGVTHLASVRVQAFVGASGALNFWSTPIDLSFFDPGFTTSDEIGGTITLTGTATATGDQLGFEFPLPTDSNVAAGSTLLLDLAGTNPGSLGGTVSVRPEQDLPAGSKIQLSFLDIGTNAGADDDLDLFNNPPFGINPVALAGQTVDPPEAPAGFFVLRLQVPGESDVDENAYFGSVTFTMNVPTAYFTSRGLVLPGAALRMRLVGFDDANGAMDSVNFPRSVDCTTVAGTCRLTYQVSQFSAFALTLGAITSTGGIGGGGSSEGTPPVTQPTAADADGDGIPDAVEQALGTDKNDASDKPSHDWSSRVTVARVGNSFVLTWTNPAGFAPMGFQVWRSNSPFALLATLPGNATVFTDVGAPETSVYKVTFYTAENEAGGYYTDAARATQAFGWTPVAGPDEPEPAEDDREDGGQGVPRAVWVLLAIALLGAAVGGFLFLQRRGGKGSA